MVTPSLGSGGGESQLVNLASSLSRMGDQITVACILDARRDLEPLHELGIGVVSLHAHRPSSRVLIVPKLARLARRADLVYCGIWDASLWGRLAAVAGRRPVVVTEHSVGRAPQVSLKGAARGRWIGLHHRLLDRVTFATVACAASQLPLLAREGVSKAKTVLIPNGVPMEELRLASRNGSARPDLGIPQDAWVIIHVGRFVPEKNQRQTLETVRRLRGELGDVHALFVGDGPGRTRVERTARELGASWAHFLGVRRDVPALLSLADLLILPSLADTMPMSLLEAIAVDVPIVATDVGDIRWILQETEAGKCIPAGDPEALAQACREVLRNPHLYAGSSTRARASRHFDAAPMAERYSRLFDAAIAGAPVLSATMR